MLLSGYLNYFFDTQIRAFRKGITSEFYQLLNKIVAVELNNMSSAISKPAAVNDWMISPSWFLYSSDERNCSNVISSDHLVYTMIRWSSSANVEPMQPCSIAVERKATIDSLISAVISLLFLLVIHTRITDDFSMQSPSHCCIPSFIQPLANHADPILV